MQWNIFSEFIGPSLKPLEVDIMSSHTTAEVGDNVDITCVSKDDYKPKPSFAILVNGQVDKRYQRCLSHKLYVWLMYQK